MPIIAGDPPIRIDVIGPLRVSVGPVIIPILSERQRCLLAALVLESPHVVSRDRLIDVLWPMAQPGSASHALRVHVSELRKRFRAACATEPLITIGDGYMLDTAVVQTDVHAVDLLVGEARAAQVAGDASGSAEASESALALWRGLPYADLADDDRAHAARGRLAELRSQLVDENIEARLALGRYSEVIVELEQAVRADPLRERSCRQLMVALYRSGRQHEALSRYEHVRAALREQLGVEPGPMLHETHLAILEHDPMLTRSFSMRSTHALPDRAFVGRQRELEELGPVVSRDQPGSVLLLSGPPGIGKTRFADELGALSGRMVLRGRCPEGAGAPPLWPIAEAVKPLGALAIDLLAERCDPLALAPLVAAVADHPPNVAPSELPAFRLTSAVVSLLHLVAAREPTLLVLDDVQWADATTLGVLTRLADTVDSSRLAIAVTYRDAPADLSPPFGPALAGLARAVRVRTCVLGPLDRHAVDNYVRSQVPDVTADIVTTLVERIEGHPLVMAELVAWMRDRGRDSLEVIPTGLAQVLSSRLNGLGDALGVLAQAAVVGRSFQIDLVARIGDVGTDELLRALDVAHRAGLIDLVDGGGRFVHALIAEAAAATLDDGTRRMLHLRIAEAWERRVDRPTVLRVTEIARHRVAALPLGDPVAAAEACVHAGTEAMAANAYEDAIHAFVGAQRACRFTDGPPDRSSTLVDALTGEGECWMVIGETNRARPLLLDAVDLARRAQDPERFALAVRVLATARSTSAGGLDDGVVALLDEAAAMLAGTDSWLLVQLLTDRALVRYRTPERLAGVALAEEALEVARRLNDPMAISFALTGLHGAVLGPDSIGQRLELVEEAIEQARTAGVEWHQSMALSFRAMARWESGDLDDAMRDVDRCTHLADRSGRTRFRWIAQSWRSLHQLFTGNELAAESGFAEALALWGPHSNTDAFMCFSAQQLNLALLRGRGGDLVELLRSAAADDPEPHVWTAFLSYPMVQGGFTDEASACLETMMGVGLDELQRTATWPVAISMLAEAAAALDHREVAAALLPLMEPFEGRFVLLNVFGGGGFCWGSFDHQIGIARAATGDRPGARASLDRAISTQERVGALPFVERSRRARAELAR